MAKTAIQQKNIDLSFSGRLIGTTDMKWARRLNRRVRLSTLLHSGFGHYEIAGSSLLVFAFGEMYELQP